MLRASTIAGTLLLLAAPAAAQQGTIAYRHSIEIDTEALDSLRSRMGARPGMRGDGAAPRGDLRGARAARQLPTERTSEVVLLFDGAVSLMRSVPPERASRGAPVDGDRRAFRERALARDGAGGLRALARMAAARPQLVAAHVDAESGRRVEHRRFLGRDFLIEDEVPTLAWKLSGDQAEYAGHAVQKATASHDGIAVEAWFAPSIPVSGGPAGYGGLPGMILVLSLDDGREQYTATAVSLGDVEAEVLEAPDEGQHVTREEFEAIVAEKLDEIRRVGGGTP